MRFSTAPRCPKEMFRFAKGKRDKDNPAQAGSPPVEGEEAALSPTSDEKPAGDIELSTAGLLSGEEGGEVADDDSSDGVAAAEDSDDVSLPKGLVGWSLIGRTPDVPQGMPGPFAADFSLRSNALQPYV
jgi:hypothetical protein